MKLFFFFENDVIECRGDAKKKEQKYRKSMLNQISKALRNGDTQSVLSCVNQIKASRQVRSNYCRRYEDRYNPSFCLMRRFSLRTIRLCCRKCSRSLHLNIIVSRNNYQRGANCAIKQGQRRAQRIFSAENFN